jgi:predicted anti-sigma-YlaC factor YlaD
MREHATHLLGAYVDGELRGSRLRWVESHLGKCAACQKEVDALLALRQVLLESPAMETITSPDRFVAQVGLKLPRRQAQPPAQRALDLSWRMVPAGLLLSWAFLQTVFLTVGVVQGVVRLGFGGEVGALLFPARTGGMFFPDVARLSQASVAEAFGILNDVVQSGGEVAWLLLLYVTLTAVIGVLYWSWLASWWALRRHREATAPNNVA